MRAVCQSGYKGVPNEFWDCQELIIAELLKDFSGDENIIKDLESIKSILEKPDSPNRLQQRLIVDTLNSLIGYLSPQ